MPGHRPRVPCCVAPAVFHQFVSGARRHLSSTPSDTGRLSAPMQPLRRRRRIVADLPGVAGGGRGAFHPNQRRSSAPVCLRRATSAPAHRKDGGRRTITVATGAAATRPARSPRDAENSGLGRCTGRRRRRRQRRQRGGGGAPLFDCHRARDPSADVAPPPPIGCRSAAAKLHSSPSVLSQIMSPES